MSFESSVEEATGGLAPFPTTRTEIINEFFGKYQHPDNYEVSFEDPLNNITFLDEDMIGEISMVLPDGPGESLEIFFRSFVNTPDNFNLELLRASMRMELDLFMRLDGPSSNLTSQLDLEGTIDGSAGFEAAGIFSRASDDLTLGSHFGAGVVSDGEQVLRGFVTPDSTDFSNLFSINAQDEQQIMTTALDDQDLINARFGLSTEVFGALGKPATADFGNTMVLTITPTNPETRIVVIPEPGPTLLLLLGSLCWMMKRHRQIAKGASF